MTGHRLPTGGRIMRDRQIHFTFNGKRLVGNHGDTLASALIANGIAVTARSFKYHRPRGIMGAGIEEPSAYVELLGEDACGNMPATIVPLKDGLAAQSVNCWPSVDFDISAVNQLVAPFIPASFYYKTFKWPKWHIYEPAIRRAAGLASPPPAAPKEGRFEARHWHCDVLIAGAGPSGLMAALTAGRAGLRVLLADEGTEAGGSLLSRHRTIGGETGEAWAAIAVTELATMENVRHIQNATVWGYREHNLLMINERQPDRSDLIGRSWRVRAEKVIIATGAIERTLVFANNERPGVMLASAVQTYINRFAVSPGQRIVVFTNNNSAYEAAADMVTAGVDIIAIIDSRKTVDDGERAQVQGIEVLANAQVEKAHGYKRVTGVSVVTSEGETRQIKCDLLAMSGGWSPTTHLYSQSRGTLQFDKTQACFVPDQPAQRVVCVGAATGHFSTQDALRDGAVAAGGKDAPETGKELTYSIEPLWHVDNTSKGGKGFVDIQNDVTTSDIHLAIREGFGAVEHVKRYTTGGMAMDQGKTGNVNIIGTIALQHGLPLEEVGTTTFRAPYSPVEFGAIAGVREQSVVLPYRHTPMTNWNMKNGGVMYEAGARWQRPGYFPRPEESFQETVNREATCVRTGVGIYDGSPLGTYELKGPDCEKLLDLLYTNMFSNLKIGMGRYGLMLTDDGLILDDGVTFKLGDNRYWMSTSTGNADIVFQYIEKILQVERPYWDVKMTNVTSQWANATVCGPDARKVLEALGTNFDITPEAFPFMGFRDGTVAGIPARVVRVSFTGELSFEINVAPRDLLTLWKDIMEAGSSFGIMPIGSEANHVLRVEKGFLSLGHEVDGTADAYDLAMGWIMSKKKADFIGKRSVDLRRSGSQTRRELVGIMSDDPNRMVPEGAQITPGGRKESSEGFVTAYVWSVALRRTVGLALIENGRGRIGETAHVRLKDETILVKISDPCFYDPKGELLRS